MQHHIDINDYNYPLPEDRIAKFPLAERSASKLLVWHDQSIEQHHFADLTEVLPADQLIVFNNTKVIRARIIMHKPSGARIEVFCLEPHTPADYETAFSQYGSCTWSCIVGGVKKWKEGFIQIDFEHQGTKVWLHAWLEQRLGREQIVRFEWNAPLSFGELLEHLGKIPIPPYLNRDTEQIDYTRYQTVYSKFEGSVAAPTAGLHFTPELIDKMTNQGFEFEQVTLHVGAGTFLPIKEEDATQHSMHTEHFEVQLSAIEHLLSKHGKITAVGTTSVRTLESLTALAWRIEQAGDPQAERVVGQWELYAIPDSFTGDKALKTLLDYLRINNIDKLKASTQIMITPCGYTFRIVQNMITNFHQPKSTLLLLIAAFTGGENWHQIYDYALSNDFRFLSYGDSSLLMR